MKIKRWLGITLASAVVCCMVVSMGGLVKLAATDPTTPLSVNKLAATDPTDPLVVHHVLASTDPTDPLTTTQA